MDIDDILIEVVLTFAKHSVCDGCKHDQSGIAELKRRFNITIRSAINKSGTDRWTGDGGKGRQYALTHIAQIASAACKAAKGNNNGVINKEILKAAADKNINDQKEAINKDPKIMAKKYGIPLELLGDFCL